MLRFASSNGPRAIGPRRSERNGYATKCTSTGFDEPLCFEQGHDAWTIRPPETTMLSPHEIATLMLLATNPLSEDFDPGDLDALCERELVALEKLASGYARGRLTAQGRSILRSVGRGG
jgi:hypothetical protein